jgi:hypothetical protein
MAIANSYFNSSPITDSDIFVGTKYATNRTVNYTAQSIADYLNVNARISISGQLTFKFTILPNVAKTIAFENGGGDGRLFSSIDKLIVSILDAGGSNITVFLDYLIDSEILLAEQNQPNAFGHYKVTNYVVTANPNFYELSLEYIGGNGNIYKDVYYDMTPWASSGGSGTTPTLQQVTDEGNVTSNDVIVRNPDDALKQVVIHPAIDDNDGSYIFAQFDEFTSVGIQANASGVSITGNFDNTRSFELSTDSISIISEEGQVSIAPGTINILSEIFPPYMNFAYEGFYCQLILTPPTAIRQIYIPDKSGTIALTSDITTPTLQEVTDEGAITDNAITVSDGTNETSIQIGQVQILDEFGNVAQIGAQGAGFTNIDGTNLSNVSLAASWGSQQTGLFLQTQDGTNIAALEIKLPVEYYTDLPVENIVSNYFIPFKPSGDYTLATLDDIPSYTVPTLQQVLDNNHDLVDENNFQGTDAGLNNTGTFVIAFGQETAKQNTGTLVNAIGSGAAAFNEGNDINALGTTALLGNQGNDVNALGWNAGIYNTFDNVNLLGRLAAADEDGQTVLSKDGIIMARISTTELTNSRKYTLQDADGTIALTSDIPAAGVTSVGLTMPSAFSVTNSPITSSGDIAVTGAGSVSQYVRGDGTLATLPTSIGGGSSVSYYLNGSVNQGTIGGVTYYEMNRTPILGIGTDFTRNTNGYIASFLTDANDPALLSIPAGNWNFETYFQASSGGGSPTFYIELYKYDGTTFSLIASNSATPKLINDGTNIEAYFSALAVPQTTLLATDRLALRIYVNTSGRTITLHTENGHLCQVITTFSTGLAALNGLTAQVQYFDEGTSGTDFNISSTTDTHTFNLPTASATNRGALSSADWTTFNNKQADLWTFQRTQGIYFFEDFLGQNDSSGIGVSTGVTMGTTGTGTANRITGVFPNRTNQSGVAQLTTGTTASGFGSIRFGSNNTPNIYLGIGTLTYETYINIETLSTGTERYIWGDGLISSSNYIAAVQGAYFIYDEGGAYNGNVFGASPNFRAVTVSPSVIRTVTNTNIAVTAGTWFKLRIEVNSTASQILFYIDDALVATHTNNLPAVTTPLFISNWFIKTIGITSRSIFKDYLAFRYIFTNPR